VPALGAAPVDGVDDIALGIKFVGAEHRNLGNLRVARRFRGDMHNRPKTSAVAQKIPNLEFLVAHHQDVMVEPGLVDWRKAGIVERLHVDAGDLDTNLRTHAAYLNHPFALPSVATPCSVWVSRVSNRES